MTTATKAGGAVLQVVGYVNTDELDRLLDPTDCAMIVTTQSGWSRTALTPHAPAQATIDELRAEVERLTGEAELLRRKWLGNRDTGHLPLVEAADQVVGALHSEVEALKAKQIDVEAVMRLAEVYAKASSELDESIRSRSRAPRMVNRHDLRVHVAFKAAREALRASLLGDGGTL